MGYPADHRGYRCFDLTTRRVITSRHVIFDEHTFPFRNARQLLGALDMSIWEMKVTSIRESTVMSTLTLDVLYSKLKTHELDVFARKNSNKSIALASQHSTSNNESSSPSFVLPFLSSLIDEQLEQLPEEELAHYSTRFDQALQNVRTRKRKSGDSRRCLERGSLKHIHPKCPKYLARIARDEEDEEEEIDCNTPLLRTCLTIV